MRILLIVIIFYSLVLKAQTYRRLTDPEKVRANKTNATLMVEIYDEKNKPHGYGAGFFYGKRGHFFTSYHVVQDYLTNKNFKLSITQQGMNKSFQDIELIKCQDNRRIDLCLFRLTKNVPSEYFEVSQISFKKGHKGYFIGHCTSPFFSKQGTLKNVYKNIYEYITAVKVLDTLDPGVNKNVEFVQMENANHCPGDSGGPLFSQKGELWGVTSEVITINHSNEKFFLYISANEVYDFFKKAKDDPVTIIPQARIFVDPQVERREDIRKIRDQLFEQ